MEAICPIQDGKSALTPLPQLICHLVSPSSSLSSATLSDAFELWSCEWLRNYRTGDMVDDYKDDKDEDDEKNAAAFSFPVRPDYGIGSSMMIREINIIGLAWHITLLAVLVDELLAVVNGILPWWVAESGAMAEEKRAALKS